MSRALPLLALVALAACGDTGQPLVQHPAVGLGTPARKVTLGGWEVSLSVARVGFGPARFCASRAASPDLCANPLAELAATASIDALSPSPQPLGTIEGFTGTVRSAGYGYAIPWLTTDTAPTPRSGAVGGHSAHLEGSARRTADGFTLAFVADVDVKPLVKGDPAVSTSGLAQAIDPSTSRLEVRFDPTAWAAQIDFDALAAKGALGTVTVAAGTQAYDALVLGMTSLAPPAFAWTR